MRVRAGLAALACGNWGMMVDMNDQNTKILVRSRNGRMLAGVCAGISDYFGIDVTLIRVIVAVVCVFTAGAGILAYLVAWMVIPEEGETASIIENIMTKGQNG
jgi:phage shock protein PspC (stress-responsive transcriptional regulator)